MKKKYIKPEMLVHEILNRGILLASRKGVYSKIDGVKDGAPTFGGYVEEDEEEEYDPD
jgi:hypothetical protein